MSNTYYSNPALDGATGNQPTPAGGSVEAPQRRRGLVLPVLLIGGGAFALALNLGLFDWPAIARFAIFWPLGLVLIGAEMLIRGRVSGVTALVAIVVMVGLLAAAAGQAVGSAGIFAPSGPTVTGSSSAAVGDITAPRLTIDGSAVRMSVHSGPLGSDLYQATWAAPVSEPAAVVLDRATGGLTVDLGHRHGWLDNGGTRRTLDVVITDRLPWRVDINSAAVSGDIDLSSAHLQSLTVDGGAAHYLIKLPVPEAEVPVRVSGGALNVELRRPAGAEMSVEVSGGANSLRVDGNSQGGLGPLLWTSDGYAAAAGRYTVTATGGATSVEVTRTGS